MVGKAADVLEDVEKIEWNGKKLPVKYFDKDANPTEKPVLNKPLPDGLTAETVIKNYVAAIGGQDKLEKCKFYRITHRMSLYKGPHLNRRPLSNKWLQINFLWKW